MAYCTCHAVYMKAWLRHGTSLEVHEWKIQLVTFIFPGKITVSQELKPFVESHLFCLPLSGRTDV